jgi:hypothetical protein
MSTRFQISMQRAPSRAAASPSASTGTQQRKCASCNGSSSAGGECESCKKKKASQLQTTGQIAARSSPPELRSGSDAVGLSLRPPPLAHNGHHFGKVRVLSAGQAEDTPAKPQEDEGEVVVVGQAAGGGGGATTPDGNDLGSTDPTKKVCMAKRSLIWVGGPGQNSATAATGTSRVTAHLGTAPAGGANCDCNCGLFRQFIRGFWRLGTPASPKRHDIGSCGTNINMNESTWTEEFEACNPGGAPISADCDRVYLDEPGFSSGLSDGTFAEVHLDLRYQLWDQCNGHEVETGDRRLRIRGDKHPRTVTFG